jgi:hypothetical protein
MATHPPTGTTPIPPGLRLTHDLNDALTTWSTSQRTVIGLAAALADSGEWMATKQHPSRVHRTGRHGAIRRPKDPAIALSRRSPGRGVGVPRRRRMPDRRTSGR